MTIHSANVLGSVSRLAGGLFNSVRNLILGLMKSDVAPQVVSLRDPFSDVDLPAWLPNRPRVYNAWNLHGFRYAPKLLADLTRQRPDLIHCHGIWQYISFASYRAASKLDCPYLISAHGMLDPWAMNHHRWRKKLVGWLFQNRVLKRASCLSALCESEYQSIRRAGFRNPVCVIPNGVALPETINRSVAPPWAGRVPDDQKVLLFLGRIHQKKGLLQLLYGLSILRQSAPREFERWSLVVAGWDDGGHQQEVESLANSLGLAARAHFVGPLVGPAKDAALTCSAAFVLPSFSEGLPMAVLEAFAYHVPVVMTPECNIPEGFTADAAISVSTDPTDLARGLGEMFRMSDSERRRMGDRGRVLVEEKFQWSEVAGKLRSVYSWLLGNGTCPNCVRMD